MSDSSSNSISHYMDELKLSWRNLRSHIFARSVAAPAAISSFGPTGQLPVAELDALAKVNEEIRERCINIVNRSDELIALRDEFIEVFGEVGKILKNTEGTSSALIERSAMLTLEEQEHNTLKLHYRALHEEHEANRNENSLLRGEVQRYGDLVAGREARIQGLEAELSAEKDGAASLKGELEQARFMTNLATEKLQAALAEIAANEALIGTLQAHSAALNDRCSAAEFHVKALQGNLAESQGLAKGLRETLTESQHKAESLGQKLGEAEIEIENFGKRVDALEAALSASRMDHEMAQVLWQRRAEADSDEIATLRAQVDAHRSHAEAADKLLAETRAELQARAAELRAKERHAELLEARIAPLDQRVKETTKEIAGLGDKVSEGEKSRAMLADRAQALVRAMSDQKAKLEVAEEHARLLEERLAAESSRFAADNEQLQHKIHALTEQIEKEKSARAVMSGALEAARSRTAARPRAAASLLDILARADEADAEDRDRESSPLPWSMRPASKRLGADSDAAAPEQGAKPKLGPAEPVGAKPALPKARSFVAKREKQHQGGRL